MNYIRIVIFILPEKEQTSDRVFHSKRICRTFKEGKAMRLE
jgi:hypothetical protein